MVSEHLRIANSERNLCLLKHIYISRSVPNRSRKRDLVISPPTPLTSEHKTDQNLIFRPNLRRATRSHAPTRRAPPPTRAGAWDAVRQPPVTKFRSIARFVLLSSIPVFVWPNSKVVFTWFRQLSLGTLNSGLLFNINLVCGYFLNLCYNLRVLHVETGQLCYPNLFWIYLSTSATLNYLLS